MESDALHRETTRMIDPDRLLSQLTPGTLLDSLKHGMHSFSLLLLTPDGLVIYANQTAVNGLGTETPDSIRGKSIYAFAPDLWGEERQRYLRQAIDEQRPLILLEIISGYRLCTHIKPISIEVEGQQEQVLLVTAELIIAANFYWLLDHAQEHNVHIANCIDLGCLNALSDRELEVLALIGQGYRQRDIAQTLNRSISTLNRHRESIGMKLKIADRAQLVRLANLALLQVDDAKRNRMQLGRQYDANEMTIHSAHINTLGRDDHED